VSAAALLGALRLGDSAFPSGAFAFSNGLETLAAEGASPADAEAMLLGQIAPRWLDFDRWFLAAAHGSAPDLDAVAAVDADCEARNAVAALAAASRRTGRAGLTTHARLGTAGAAEYLARVKAGEAPGHAAVAQGLAAQALGLGLAEAEAVAFHGVLAGWASAAVRLGLTGALDAQGMVARAGAALAPRLDAPPPAQPFAFAPLADAAAARRPASPARLFAN
jgi:urease accessory protein